MGGSGSASPPYYFAAVAGPPLVSSEMLLSTDSTAVEKPSTDSTAVEKPSTDSAAVEEPSVHKLRQVTKFEDRYCRVIPYCETFLFEVDPNSDPSLECDTDSEDEACAKPPIESAKASIPTLVKYVNQIRESFGFDVDCVAPNWFQGSFYPIDMAWTKLEKEWLYKKIYEFADFAIAEINVDLIHDGKSSIELLELEKVVWAVPDMDLLTLRVKTKEDDMNVQTIQAIIYEGHGSDAPLSLEQWRFKPVEPDFWYKAPPIPLTQTQTGDDL